MRKILFFLTTISIACIIIFFIMKSSNKAIDIAPSRFFISNGDLKLLKKKAQDGDCEAAYQIGLHFTYYKYQPDEAVKWLRLAARCPSIEAKEHLIAALLGVGNQPNTMAEIDNLILEIKKIDPAAALKSEEGVKSVRQTP